MCASTLAAGLLMQNLFLYYSDDGAILVLLITMPFAGIAWVAGLVMYWQSFKETEKSDIIARNKGAMYGLGVGIVSLTMSIMWPWIGDGINMAIKISPVYLGMLIGALQ